MAIKSFHRWLLAIQGVATSTHSITQETFGLGDFLPGQNLIQFEVANTGTDPSAMALRLEGSVVASVPEPTTFAFAAIGPHSRQSPDRRNRYKCR